MTVNDYFEIDMLLGVDAFFYFYFFDDLYYIEDIQQAFKNICLDKMLSDGYFDMSAYIFGRLKKEDIYARLVASKSRYAVLYRGRFPNKNTASSVWRQKMGEGSYNDDTYRSRCELTYLESSAIVNWVYKTLKNSEERNTFTKELLGQIKELHGIQNDIRFSKGVVYNAEKVEIHFLSSVSSVNSYVSSLKKEAGTLFFRGHANPNYILRPSIMRTPRLLQNESEIYHELIINCPDDFEKCHTHLEKLVKMQHYGLPTRLLDITRNPLVALYFACESNPESYGELVLISPENHEIKYPQSDTVSILASLPVFSYKQQQEFGRLASDPTVSQHDFNKKVDRLLHEVRLEKPAFLSEIKKDDLVSSFIVYALKNNDRIVKQDGAFILCGLPDGERSLEEFRYRENGKKVVILIDGKKKLLEQLETFSINRAALFPEIECVAEYLKNKYTS